MPGKTKEELVDLLQRVTALARKNSVAQPHNFRDICARIVDGNQDERDSAEKDLTNWALRIKAAKTTSVPPTQEHVQQVLGPRRDALAQAKTTLGTAATAASSTPASKQPAAVSPVAATGFGIAIARFAASAAKEKKQIGNGECWTLANDAMLAAGASPPMYRGDPLNFGRLLGEITPTDKTTIDAAQAGDILQYYSVTIRIVQGTSTMTMTMGQHTAIVVAPPAGNKLRVIEANVSGVKTPQLGEVNFDGMISGSVKVWRAVAPPPPHH